MMERLFTESDVLRLLAAARQVGPFPPGEDAGQWARVCLEYYAGDFPADEPMFLLRASEEASTDVLARVYNCEEYVRDQEHYTDLVRLQFAFANWREAQE